MSIIIRLELSAPGVGILHGDNQLYNTIVTAHAFLISTPSNIVQISKQSYEGDCFTYGRTSYVALISGMIEPNKTIMAVVGYFALLYQMILLKFDRAEGAVSYWWRSETWHRLCGSGGPISTTQFRRLMLSWSNDIVMKIKTDIISWLYILPAKTTSREDEYNLQAPNRNDLDISPLHTHTPVGVRGEPCQNELNSGIRDATAYTRNQSHSVALGPDPENSEDTGKRTRSLRSRGHQASKGGSKRNTVATNQIFKNRNERLDRVIKEQLEHFKDQNGKYNGIIRMMNTEILKESYSLIKSNPGNIRVTSETLDKINTEWFERVHKDSVEGRFKFTPARLKKIYKPNAPDSFRSLLIANPREKLFKKLYRLF